LVDVHIVPGDSAAGGLRIALQDAVEHQVVGLSDPLSCGPLRSTTSLEEWTTCRRRFWSEVLESELLEQDGVPQDVELLRRAGTITLWLGNGLGDQLALPWFCWLAEVLAIPVDRVRVVQFPLGFVSWHRTPSLGMLSPELIREHPPARPLGMSEASGLLAMWGAITDPDPTSLSALLLQVRDACPHESLLRLAWRYPHVDTGLSFWDRALLENVRAQESKAALVVANTLAGPAWDVDPLGDGWLFWRLRRLSAMSVPLLRLVHTTGALSAAIVELTPEGQQVLDGTRNALDLNPIDDWVAGVHLASSTGGTWVTSAGPELNATPLPNSGLQLTWRSLALAPRS
jgi:hypothetical protein